MVIIQFIGDLNHRHLGCTKVSLCMQTVFTECLDTSIAIYSSQLPSAMSINVVMVAPARTGRLGISDVFVHREHLENYVNKVQ